MTVLMTAIIKRFRTDGDKAADDGDGGRRHKR